MVISTLRMIESERVARKTWRPSSEINSPANAWFGLVWARVHWPDWCISKGVWTEPFIVRKCWRRLFWRTWWSGRNPLECPFISGKCSKATRTWSSSKTLRNHIPRTSTRHSWMRIFPHTLLHFGGMRERTTYSLVQSGTTSGLSSGIGGSVLNEFIEILARPTSAAWCVDCERKFGTLTQKHWWNSCTRCQRKWTKFTAWRERKSHRTSMPARVHLLASVLCAVNSWYLFSKKFLESFV